MKQVLKEFNAVNDLYTGLVQAYGRLSYTDEAFEENYVASHCILERKITEFLHQTDRALIVKDMDKDLVKFCLTELVKMEQALNQLQNR